jgi:FdhD protein
MINILQTEKNKGPVYGEFPAYEYFENSLRPVIVPLSMEYSLTLSINGSPYVAIACSGGDLREMAFGHLVSEGFVRSKSDIREMNFDEENSILDAVLAVDDRMLDKLLRLRRMPSGCGQAGGEIDIPEKTKGNPLKVSAETVTAVMKAFLNHSSLHKLTRGVHSAALSSVSGEIIAFFDEIGRHNAIDKVIGYALLNGISLHETVILTTGRVSSEIAIKLLNANAGTLISRASPTSLSYELSNTHGLTLIGRVRGGTFSVFSGHENIIIPGGV